MKPWAIKSLQSQEVLRRKQNPTLEQKFLSRNWKAWQGLQNRKVQNSPRKLQMRDMRRVAYQGPGRSKKPLSEPTTRRIHMQLSSRSNCQSSRKIAFSFLKSQLNSISWYCDRHIPGPNEFYKIVSYNSEMQSSSTQLLHNYDLSSLCVV